MTKKQKYDNILAMETIRDIVIEKIKKQTNYSDTTIERVIKQVEEMKIKQSNLFAKFLNKTFDEVGIIDVKDLFKLTQDEAKTILKLEKYAVKNYINNISEKIIDAMKRKNEVIQNKKEATKKQKITESIINEIKNNEKILNLLKLEIIYKEQYNNLSLEDKRLKRPFYCTYLNLNNEELDLLRNLLLGKTEYDTTDREFNKLIIKISSELEFYLKKLEYKSKINETYLSLNEIELSTYNRRLLGILNIKYVSDLIDINNSIETRHILKKFKNPIEEALSEKKIIIPKNKEELDKVLSLENAGIKQLKRIAK